VPPRLATARVLPLALLAGALAGCATASRLPDGPPLAGGRAGAQVASREAPLASVAVAAGEGVRLVLSLSPGWRATVLEAELEQAAPVRLDPPGTRLVMMVRPVGEPGAKAGPDDARSWTEQARDQARPTAAEPELALRVLRGAQGGGWYFSATDRELAGGRRAEPDEFRCLTQGAVALDGLVVAFSVLDDGPGGPRPAPDRWR
jgi:hypothetical protein